MDGSLAKQLVGRSSLHCLAWEAVAGRGSKECHYLHAGEEEGRPRPQEARLRADAEVASTRTLYVHREHILVWWAVHTCAEQVDFELQPAHMDYW